MSGIDASFLYLESPYLLAHTIKILELEVPDTWRFERTRRAIADVLPHLEAYCRRALMVPLRLHHPVWIHDREVDLDWHVKHHVLPAPGDDHAFSAFIAAFASEPLDRERPLWQLYVVEGRAHGRLAVVIKVHHALADGAAVASLFDAVSSREPRSPGERPDLPTTPSRLEPTPTRWALARAALRERVLALRDLPSLARDSVMRLGRWWGARRRSSRTPPLPFAAHHTSFNQPLTRRRAFGRKALPLDLIRQVKDTWGCTVNDVVLALVAGAVRRYLLDRGEPIEGPLTASLPVAASDERYFAGNRVSNLFVALPVHLPDPVARLVAIREGTEAVKAVHEHLGRDMMRRWLELAGPLVLRAWWVLLARSFAPPAVNLIVSSVRGPTEHRWLGGSAVTGVWSVGPVLERIGLNVTVWSYEDRLYASVLSCPRNLPWPQQLADGLEDALVELMRTAVPRERRSLVDVDAAPAARAQRALKGETVQ